MANRIKGITIEIGGDTTGLDKALRGVNSELRNTQNELREVENSLRLDPGNVVILEQKQRALNKAVDATKEKLDTLQEAQRQMASNGLTDKNRAQYDALTREINNTQKALEEAEKAARDFGSVSLQKLSSQLDQVSDKAGQFANATKGISTVAAGVVGGIGTMALKSAQSADELNTLSQQSGLTTEELQKMKYASDLVDVSMEDMVSAQSKLRKSMAGNGEAFAQLGVAVTTSDGQMRDSTEVFYDVLQALSRVGNETERDQIAMDIFGKSSDQLAGIIDDGGAALKQYGNEAKDLGLVLDQDTLDSMNQVNDSIDRMKAKFSGNFMRAGAEALQKLEPVFNEVIDAITKVIEYLGKLDGDTWMIIGTVAAVVAAISPVASMISNVTGAISGLLDIWPAIQSAGAAISAFVAANPIVLIIGAIVMLAAIIIANWDKIRPVLEEIWEKVKEIVGNIVEKVRDFVAGIKDAFRNIVNAVKSTFQAVRDAIVNKFNEIKEKAIAAWEAVRDAVTNVFTAIADNVKEKINAVIGFVNQGITAINNLIEGINNSGLGKTLGINIGSLGTIPTLQTSGDALLSQNGRSSGSMTSNTYNTSNVYNQIPQQPINVNLNLDGNTLARQMVSPMRSANAAAGSSNMN